MTDDDDGTPSRTLDKQEAIRHLIHTAIRLIAKRENPFAIHVLVHSADKLLIDMAKSRGRKLRVDLETYIKPEYRKEFFEKHRALYNYFKHADKDFDVDLPVRDIMKRNVMTLFISVANYSELFGKTTNHMILLMVFVICDFETAISRKCKTLARQSAWGLSAEPWSGRRSGSLPGRFATTFATTQGSAPPIADVVVHSSKNSRKPSGHSSGTPTLRSPAKKVASCSSRIAGTPQLPRLIAAMLEYALPPNSLRASASSAAARSKSLLSA
jgi:hypothetical protein